MGKVPPYQYSTMIEPAVLLMTLYRIMISCTPNAQGMPDQGMTLTGTCSGMAVLSMTSPMLDIRGW